MYTVEYKTPGGYTNKNPYTSKDRVADYGKNGYSVFPKPQVKTEQHTNNNNLWSVPKTHKDGLQTIYGGIHTKDKSVQNYGLNRDITQSMPAKTDPAKELYVEYLKTLNENNKGVNREIVQNTFLDHRGQNPV